MNIHTSTAKTTHPITKLYPLEVKLHPHSVTENDNSSSDSAKELVSMPSQQMITEQSRIQPLRKAAMRARKQFS